MIERNIPVEYLCRKCGSPFTIMQSAPGADENIDLCGDCIVELFEQNKREEHVRKVREALHQLRGLDEAGKVCWLLGISREKLDELGGLG